METNPLPAPVPSATAIIPMKHPEGTQCESTRYWPQIAQCTSKESFQRCNLFIAPFLHRKLLNSLTGDIWFFVIYHFFLIFPTTWCLLQNPIHSDSSLASWEWTLRAIREAASWAKFSKKINSQLLGYTLFSVNFLFKLLNKTDSPENLKAKFSWESHNSLIPETSMAHPGHRCR